VYITGFLKNSMMVKPWVFARSVAGKKFSNPVLNCRQGRESLQHKIYVSALIPRTWLQLYFTTIVISFKKLQALIPTKQGLNNKNY
jgi:hypothetical protein